MSVLISSLNGSRVSLRRIAQADLTPLHSLIKAQPEIYQYSNIGATSERFGLWFEQALREQAYVVVDNATGKLLGSSRFYNHNTLVPHTYIGYTWYDANAHGTHVNPEVKLLMLSHAFEDMGLLRVGFEVDAQNLRSRAAVLKLGAQHEGVLRHHRRRWSDGALSDTYSFSILLEEWPAVKAGLLARLTG